MSAVQNLHQEALVIDSHNDTIVAHIRCGNIGLKGEQGPSAGREPAWWPIWDNPAAPWCRSFNSTSPRCEKAA